MIYQEKIFTKEECDKILSYKEIYTDLPFRKTEPVIDLDNRRIDQFIKLENGKKTGKFFNVWDIPNDSNTHWFFEKIIKWFSNISQIEVKDANYYPIGCGLHKYSKGDLFQKHIDLSKEHYDRRWNLGIQLNDEYTGGEYICYDSNDNEIILSKEAGTALAYDSKTFHEIKEIKSGERYSIVLTLTKHTIIEKKHIL